jgi:hypothetical protein
MSDVGNFVVWQTGTYWYSVWYGVVWCGVVWCGVVWCDKLVHKVFMSVVSIPLCYIKFSSYTLSNTARFYTVLQFIRYQYFIVFYSLSDTNIL